MATQVQLRRGTSTQNDSFTGAQGELTFDTTNKRVRIHDGATAGGFELKTENAGGDTLFADNEKAIFGAGSDLEISSNGASAIIRAGNASSDIRLESDNRIVICDRAFNETFAVFNDDDDVKLYHNNFEKLATTATGIDVTGTVTSDGLTVVGGTSGFDQINLSSNVTNNTAKYSGIVMNNYGNTTTALLGGKAENGTTSVYYGSSGSDHRGAQNHIFYTNASATATSGNTKRLNIASNGDISFYEDTGTTAKFFWDSSAESLGIGTTSVDTQLHVKSSSDTFIKVEKTGADNLNLIATGAGSRVRASGALIFDTGGGSERMRIDSSGNAIFTKSGGAYLQLKDASAVRGAINVGTSDGLVFTTGSSFTEAMRIDSSGNVLVGTTDTSLWNDNADEYGHNILAHGQYYSSTNGEINAYLNRQNSDGAIIAFAKDGAAVGNIATWDGDLAIGQVNVAFKFDDGGNQILPWSVNSNLNRDGGVDLGDSTSRWKDLYLSGGVYLGGTGAANKLDDYDEGTWNPNPRGATTAGTYSLQYRLGNYVKVGNMVQCDCTITVTNFTGTGDFEISGLPFTNASTAPGGLVLAQWNVCPFATYSSSDQHVVGLIPPNQSYVHFRASDHNQGGQLTQLQCGNSNITFLRLSMTYKTA